MALRCGAVPTYLRWIAALSTGITAQIIFTLVTVPLRPETTVNEAGQTGLQVDGLVIILTLLNTVIAMSAALWVNNWILRRYPKES